MISKWVRDFILVVGAGMLLASPSFGQEARGRIVGRVADVTGGAVPEASVRITNIANGRSTVSLSNIEGHYQALYLIPGLYTLEVEKSGFKRFVREQINLRVDDRLEIDVDLDLGDVAESITVSGETPLLETVSASMGQVIDARRVADLPIAHGVAYHLISLAPGASFASAAAPHSRFDQPYAPANVVDYAINGTRSGRSEIMIDGVSNTAAANANQVSAAYVPPADIVSEIKVQTASFDATTGQTEGGVVNISLKSGTNALHGTALYAKMDPGLEANSFLANKAGQPKGNYNYNRWGATLSGPIVRNRTFFLYGYEAIHTATPRGTILTVPTAIQRNGDFSDLLRLGSQYQIYDPATRRAIPGGRFESSPLVNNIIAPTRIDPVAKNILEYYPLPTAPGTSDGRNNLPLLTKTEGLKYYTHTSRLDHYLTEKHRIFGRVNVYKRQSIFDDWFDNAATGSFFEFLSRGGALDDVYTFSPSLVLNVRYGYARFVRSFDAGPETVGFDVTTLGFPASYQNLIDPSIRRFPQITIGNYAGTYGSGIRWQATDTHTFYGAFDKVAGMHGLKFGAEYRIYNDNQYEYPTSTTGRFDFGSTWTRGPLDNSPASPIGQDLASFLLGLPAGGFVDRNASFAEQSTVWSLFVQDDWKMTPRLTVTMGLRYELEGPLTERFNRSVRGFDSDAQLPIAAQVQANYALNPTQEIPPSQFVVKGGLTFAGVNGLPRTLWGRDRNNFMPRIGLAYQLTPKTVLRSGYGIFFGFLGERRGDVNLTGFSQRTELAPSLDGGITFRETLSNPFPGGVLEPRGSSLGPSTNLGSDVRFFNEKPLAPYMQRWQFSIQREWSRQLVTEVGYVGNRGTHIENQRLMSALPNEYLSRSPERDSGAINYLTANLANPFYPLLPGTGRSGQLISRSALLQPLPQFTSVLGTDNLGYSWYHSLQARVEKRFSSSYTLQLAYTWSKFMEAVEYLNAADPVPVKAISPQDYPHHVSLSGIWELPFGRGRRWVSGARGVLEKLVGGWQVQGVCQFQSGQALGFGNALFRGDLKDIPLPSGQRSVERWFNTDAGFERATAKQLAFNLVTLSPRFSGIRRDGDSNWDLSVIKYFELTEKVRIQFRGEFLNAFNHPRFGNPVTNPTSSDFGVVTSERGYPRRIQLQLKLVF